MAKILIVDDEEGIRRELTVLLREEGYSAECAASGTSAISFMSEQTFDIVITDLKMPVCACVCRHRQAECRNSWRIPLLLNAQFT